MILRRILLSFALCIGLTGGAFAAGKPNIVVVGADSDPASVRHDSRIFARAYAALSDQLHEAGFDVFDAVDLLPPAADRARRSFGRKTYLGERSAARSKNKTEGATDPRRGATRLRAGARRVHTAGRDGHGGISRRVPRLRAPPSGAGQRPASRILVRIRRAERASIPQFAKNVGPYGASRPRGFRR